MRTDDSTREPDWAGMTVQNTHGRIYRNTVLLLIYNRLIYKNQSHRMRNARVQKTKYNHRQMENCKMINKSIKTNKNRN